MPILWYLEYINNEKIIFIFFNKIIFTIIVDFIGVWQVWQFFIKSNI